MALVAHGNAWLQRPDVGPPPSLEVDSSTFQYVRSVAFVASTGPVASRSPTVDAVAPWLTALRSSGLDRLRLALGSALGPLPDHLAVAFAGGGNWHLLATGADASSMLWTAAWSVGDRSAPDRRIWEVRYDGREVPPTVFPARMPVEIAERQLVDAVVATQSFAREQDLEFWSDYLGKVLDLQNAARPEAPYHPDLLPADSYSDAARRLIAMTSQAWVFGGMGSWNDLGFETAADNNRYHQLTRDLYDAVLGAAAAAVNTDILG